MKTILRIVICRKVDEICENYFSFVADDCSDDSEDCDHTGGFDGK